MAAVARTVPVSTTPYPGASATPLELLALADEYRAAVALLDGLARPGQQCSRAPFRLVAIHAIELYLSAFLMSAGETAETIRSYGHNLAIRRERAIPHGLVLRLRTQAHLDLLSHKREYLVSRYGTDAMQDLSQPKRLAATLTEVANKVTAALRTKAG